MGRGERWSEVTLERFEVKMGHEGWKTGVLLGG